jgi:hypothetical protein
MSNSGPNLWASIAGRKGSQRALKRAAEAKARKELEGLSGPQAAALLRRKKGKSK